MSEEIKSPEELEALETVKQQIEEEYKNKRRRITLKDILLSPFKAIKNLFQWVGDTIFVKTIPKEERAEVLQKAIDESYKETKRLQEEARKPDAKVQEMKKEILQNNELTMEQKIEALCELTLQSGKDITVALTKDIEPDKTKVPDAILVFERQGDYVQIQYATKEFKTKNAKPSYNLAIKGGINYDEKGNITHKGLEETLRIFKQGFTPDMDRIYIDKNSMTVESSQNILQNDITPTTNEKNKENVQVTTIEKTEDIIESEMNKNIEQAVADWKVVIPENNPYQDISINPRASYGIDDEFEEPQALQTILLEENQELEGMTVLFPEEGLVDVERESEEEFLSENILDEVLKGNPDKANEIVNKDNLKKEKENKNKDIDIEL